MKLFLISNMYPSEKDPDYGVFVRNIENSLVENGAIVSETSLIKGRPQNPMDKIIKYVKFYISIIYNFYFGSYDLIYVHFVSHSSPVLSLLNVFSFKKRMIVSNVHGSDVLTHNKGILKPFIRSLLKNSSLVIVPSSYFLKVVKMKFPFTDDTKIVVSPSGGIDSKVFFPLKRTANPVLHLGFVSRIEEDKGWRVLLESLIQLRNKKISFRCDFVGKGSQVEELKLEIKNKNLENQVHFLGLMNQEKLNEFYNSLDIFVFPTMRESESLGLVGLEAMACGTPVIGSEMAGIVTYVNEKENGFLFMPGSVNELVNCIIQFNELSEIEKNELRENALKTAQFYEKNSVSKNLYECFVGLNTEKNNLCKK